MESVLVLILMFGIIPAIISLLAGYIYGRRTQKRGLDLIFDLIKPYFIVNSIIFIPLAIGTAGFADSPGMLPALLLIAFILLFMLMPLMLPFALLGTHIYRHFKIKIPKPSLKLLNL